MTTPHSSLTPAGPPAADGGAGRPDGLDTAALTGPVRELLGDPDADVLAWESRSIYSPVIPDTIGVYRVAGRARSPRADAPWSLVLKIVRSPDGVPDDQVSHAREVLLVEVFTQEQRFLIDLADEARALLPTVSAA